MILGIQRTKKVIIFFISLDEIVENVLVNKLSKMTITKNISLMGS